MSKGKAKDKTKRRRITFSLEAPEAQEVVVVGDFNKWNTKTHPLKKDESGVWKKIVVFRAGSYEYKFLVDGKWRTDPKNYQTCRNPFGTHNSVLTV